MTSFNLINVRNCKVSTNSKGGSKWGTNKVTIDSAAGRGRCTRRFAQTVKKNATSLLNQAAIVLYTARNVFRSAKIAAVKPPAYSR